MQQSFEKLSAEYDVVVIEGAGSPAEINLRRFDIANMAMAKLAKAPVILVGDIHVGGVFGWLVGTLELLQPDERALIKAFVINKFRGDISLLDEGISFLEERTRKEHRYLNIGASALSSIFFDSQPRIRYFQDSVRRLLHIPHEPKQG